jgi:uncharacterized protein YqeY
MKNRIKSDMVNAMKEKNIVVRDILRVVKGEIERNEQSKDGKVELSDVEVVKIVKKMIENSQDQAEKDVLETYLPQQMTGNELMEQAAGFIATHKLDSPKEMGKVMAYFKQYFDGTYDGGELSKITRELLN